LLSLKFPLAGFAALQNPYGGMPPFYQKFLAVFRNNKYLSGQKAPIFTALVNNRPNEEKNHVK